MKNTKFRLVYLIMALFAFVFGSVLFFYDYYESGAGMKLFAGIVFAILAVFKSEDLYLFIKKIRNS